jgi:hypothetical protein
VRAVFGADKLASFALGGFVIGVATELGTLSDADAIVAHKSFVEGGVRGAKRAVEYGLARQRETLRKSESLLRSLGPET